MAMRLQQRWLALCSSAIIALLLGAGGANAQDFDNELWLDQRVAVRLSPDTSLRLTFAERLDRGASNLGEAFLQFGVAFEVRSWLTLTPGYRFTSTNSFQSSANHEHRPQLDVTLQAKRPKWRSSLRTRFEGRLPNNRAASLRMRMRPEVQRELPFGRGRRPSLAISNEFFYEVNSNTYTRNRAQAGIWFHPARHFSVQPYYLLESNRTSTSWDHDNIWGLSLAWSF